MGIKVLIVDDSAVIRTAFTEILRQSPDITEVLTAADPLFAMQKMEHFTPDVVVLDIQMPRMDGITFLKKLMVDSPLPVIICSSLTQENSEVSLKAMSAGAVDVIDKPPSSLNQQFDQCAQNVLDAILEASKANLNIHFQNELSDNKPEEFAFESNFHLTTSPHFDATKKLIAIGTSTGVTQALEEILPRVNANTPGIVIVQHMPAAFTKNFAQRLDKLSKIHVKEAEDGEPIEPGKAIVAPGDKHLLVSTNFSGDLIAKVQHGPPVSRHCPSADVLFRSVAEAVGRNALGLILTGMGKDGAAGLKKMLEAGSITVGQDEKSSIIYGMPSAAADIGATQFQVSLGQVAALINRFSGL